MVPTQSLNPSLWIPVSGSTAASAGCLPSPDTVHAMKSADGLPCRYAAGLETRIVDAVGRLVAGMESSAPVETAQPRL